MSEEKVKKRKVSDGEVKGVESGVKTKEKMKKYGPLPRFQHQRLWSRAVIIVGVLIYLWYYSNDGKETVLAARRDNLKNRGMSFACDDAYKADVEKFSGCVPKKCGRFVTDDLVTQKEASILLKMAKTGLALGGSSGGASILDVHSGALTYGDKFRNIHVLPEATTVFTAENVATYASIESKIRTNIAELFGINADVLHLTHPTFFSKLTSVPAKTIHDEYWHEHVDKVTYESFHYTSLLYLSNHGSDFTRGRFIFRDNNRDNVTVEPKIGRVSMFTSGAENVHFVEKVTSGERYAITVSFTCDETKAVKLPKVKVNPEK